MLFQMLLCDHVTLNFNNKISTGYRKAFDTKWHTGLLYKLSKLNVSTRNVKLIFLQQKFCLGTRRNVCAKVYASSGAIRFRLSPNLYNLYINDTPQL
jgi:hypothetical protein